MIRKYSPYVWIDKKIIPRQEAKISLFAHSILYGDGVFEGIKIYKCSDGRFAIFRLDDHLKRLFNSVSVIGLKITFTPEEIKQAVIDTAKKNIPEGDYIRPLVFADEEDVESFPRSNPVRLAILMWEWEPYWGPEASRNGLSGERTGAVLPGETAKARKQPEAGPLEQRPDQCAFHADLCRRPQRYDLVGAAGGKCRRRLSV